MKNNNIFLVGPMGAGKTTIGRMVARRLNLKFYDADHVIELRSGASIAWIFDLEGEEGFRRREKEVIAELTAKRNIVLATGGGAILAPANRQCLINSGFTVYLQVSLNEQLHRLQKSQHRPLLATNDRKTTLTNLIKVREPLYQEVADIVVSTDNRNINIIVDEIIAGWQGN